jgi:hypothetical protein
VRRFTPAARAALLRVVPLAAALPHAHLDGLTVPGTGAQPTNPAPDPAQPASNGSTPGYSQGVNYPIQNGDQTPGTSPPILGGTNGITDPGYSQGVNYPILNGDQGGAGPTGGNATVRQAQLLLAAWAKAHPSDGGDFGTNLADFNGLVSPRFTQGLARYQGWHNRQNLAPTLRSDGQLDQATYDALIQDTSGTLAQHAPGAAQTPSTSSSSSSTTGTVVALGAVGLAVWWFLK